jgi:UDP-3-O-[3-hydroxymyristoyl] glucosamine N-acyltransferase
MLKKAKEIAGFIGGELVGDGDISVSDIKDIGEAQKGDLAFILHPKFSGLLAATKASCVIVPYEIDKAGTTIIRVKNPSLAFSKIVSFLNVGTIPHRKGVHKTACIGEHVSLGKDVDIGAYAVIEDDAVIGDKTVIYPFCYVGHKTVIGANCVIYPNVSIRENIKIGSRVIIHPGSVIGSDGFGYDSSTGVHVKIPQIGNVIIGDDVEIGACVTIDRAKFSSTKIGKGTKIDNLVQIAHKVEIGPNCIIVAQCGVSGSSKLGSYVVLAGQVGLVDHVTIGDGAIITAQTGVSKDVPPRAVMFGSPARLLSKQKRMIAVQDRLPEIYARLVKIEKKLGIEKE